MTNEDGPITSSWPSTDPPSSFTAAVHGSQEDSHASEVNSLLLSPHKPLQPPRASRLAPITSSPSLPLPAVDTPAASVTEDVPQVPSTPLSHRSDPTSSTPIYPRGTRRPRSDSVGEDSEEPPQRRQRQSTATSPSTPTQSNDLHTASALGTGSVTSPSLSPTIVKSTTSPSKRGMPGEMGPPTTTYHVPSAPAQAGPSSNVHPMSSRPPDDFRTLLGAVQQVEGGQWMYDEDRGWDDDAHLELPLVNDGEATPSSITLRPGSKRMPIEREEIVRLMLQGLRDAGYNQSAEVLEAESGFVLASSAATDFQKAILGGRWSEALGYLSQLGFDMSEPFPPVSIKAEPNSRAPSLDEGLAGRATNGSSSSAHSTPTQLTPARHARFLISQQKYLEQLELGQQKKALATLRSELTPIAKDREVLHTITGYMMCLDKEDLYDKAEWDGAAGSSRSKLLEQLQAYIPPRVMVPQKRLATLLDQARRYQAQTCMYHQITESAPSLYTDHSCRAGSFPTATTHILADHTDEVWRIEWSPDGSMLASAGKDKQVVIWLLEPSINTRRSKWSLRPLHHLREHRDPVDVISWSPDGSTLVTGADKGLYLWDPKTGLQKLSSMGASPHNDQISAIQWMPDGSEFIVASLDRKIVFYSPSGEIRRVWSLHTTQITDFVITPDATRLVALSTSLERVPVNSKLKQSTSIRLPEPPRPSALSSLSRLPGRAGDDMGFGYGTMEHGIMMIRLADKEVVDWSNDLHCDITGIRLSWDGKRVLISCNPDEVQMWQIEPSLRKIRSFRGHVQSRFLIRSCFGAVKDRFVLSGSEDGQVYAWQTNLNKAVEVLEGHTATVNSVAWNPIASRRLFASCSDDNTVRIWQPLYPNESEESEPKSELMEGAHSNGEGRQEGMDI